MAQQWPEPISDVTLGKALQRIDFTREKRPTAIANEMNSSAKLSKKQLDLLQISASSP
jgi:hypothetical protein